MSKVSGDQLYHPFEKVRRPSTLAPSYKHVQQHAYALIKEVFTKRSEAGFKNPFLVCAINRSKPEIHRWFNLATRIDEANINPADFGLYENAGALAHAEALLDGEWYIGSKDEETACAAKDVKEREEALKRNTSEQAGKDATNLFTSLRRFADAQEQAQPALAMASGSEPKKK